MHEESHATPLPGMEPSQPSQPLRTPRSAADLQARVARAAAHPGSAGSESLLRQPRFRIGAIVALAIAVGFLVWIVVGRGNGGNGVQTPQAGGKTGPTALTFEGLQQMSAGLKQPIYWSGPQPGYKYEFTHTSNGRSFVRYLPPGVDAGAPGADYLIVATYPFRNAFRTLQKLANGAGAELPGGGLAYQDPAYPKSVHVAFRGVQYQIEVYDPSPEEAMRVATSAQVQPVR